MGISTRIICKDSKGKIFDVGSYDYYGNWGEEPLDKKYKLIDSYNEAFGQHRRWADKYFPNRKKL